MATTRRTALGIILLISTACAARNRVAETPMPDLAAADALVRAGCYTCLRDAAATYDTAAGLRRAPADVPQKRFETLILLTLRAKEIGLAFEPWLDRARTAATMLPASSGAASVLELAELAPMDTSGFAPGPPGLTRFAREIVPALAAWRERMAATTLSPATKQYLDLTLACADRETRLALLDTPPPADSTALNRYRRATCNPAPDAAVGRLAEEDPRWAEAAWFEGRRALAAQQELNGVIALLARASSAFPESGAMLMSLAGAQRAADQLDEALATYDAVLALAPEHRWALLGRVLCLTYLERRVEAVETATRMIDLGTHLMGDAYYWRAWNRYLLKSLDEAWADINLALTQQANTTVHTLAGLIAYARKELLTALEHFDRAWTLDNGNCDAGWYKGIVQAEQNAWRESAPTFSSAMTCFIATAAGARSEITRVRTATQSDAYKARREAELQKSAEENERKAATAAYNAAQAFGRTNQVPQALTHLDTAETHAAMKEKADALRRLLTRQGPG